MPARKAPANKIADAIPEKVEDAFKMLTARANESGITKFIERNQARFNPIAEAVRKNLHDSVGAKIGEFDERFIVNREVIAEVFRQHLYWALRWMTPETDRDRVDKVHYVYCDFLERGMAAIPDEWRNVGEFYDRRRFVKTRDSAGRPRTVDVTAQIFMIPRGEGKSFLNRVDAIRQIAIDPGSKWFMGQYTLDLSRQSVNATQKMLQSPYLALLMPDIFCPTKKEYLSRGGRMTMNLVDIVQPFPETGAFDMRQEYTLSAISLDSYSTGGHPNGGFYDDLDNEDSTRTQNAANEVEKFWRKQTALANRPGIFPRRLTDTFHYEDGLCERVKMESTYFRMPIEWVIDGKRKFIRVSHTAEHVDAMKTEWGVWAQAHGCIKPMPRDDKRVNIGFDKNNKRHLLDITDTELEKMKAAHVIVSVGDPAYVDTGKKLGDRKSRATILHLLREPAHTYIFDIWQTTGLDIEAWRDRVKKEVTEKNSDLYIQDTLGTQMAYFGYVENAVREVTNRRCRCVRHDKKGNIGKMSIANDILRELFTEGEITVLRTPKNAHRIQLVVDQLSGVNLGLDIIDCLVYAIDDIEIESEFPMAMRRRRRAKEPIPESAPLMDRRLKMSGK